MTRTPKPHDKQSLTTLKPKLRAFMDKYASTTIDPVELIKKYHRSQKRGNADQAKRKFTSKFQEAGKEEEANRKYPTKFLHSESGDHDESGHKRRLPSLYDLSKLQEETIG